MKTTVFFDFETGGVRDDSPNIQLAAVAIDGEWNELALFETKIQFNESAADPEALKINRYDPMEWKDAKPEAEVARLFSEFLRPFCSVEKTSKKGSSYLVARLAGHNAATFDGPRLRRMFESARLFLPAELFVRDTLQRALWYFDERGETVSSLRLTELCKHFDIPCDGAHDALTDVRLSIAIARKMAGPK
jgi:DNA polymerase III epsilon subunit-like protein